MYGSVKLDQCMAMPRTGQISSLLLMILDARSTDAGQFAMIESVTTKDKKVEFEFVAAVPAEKDTSKYENGIGPLEFDRISMISFPGEYTQHEMVQNKQCTPCHAHFLTSVAPSRKIISRQTNNGINNQHETCICTTTGGQQYGEISPCEMDEFR